MTEAAARAEVGTEGLECQAVRVVWKAALAAPPVMAGEEVPWAVGA